MWNNNSATCHNSEEINQLNWRKEIAAPTIGSPTSRRILNRRKLVGLYLRNSQLGSSDSISLPKSPNRRSLLPATAAAKVLYKGKP
ncbi:hypothetical protein TIFTF001_020183 [Ficus carica]|uniref:Uncharacterized protein n=1 Tax=Ficus carica TaxID=3494 RepID=A0AA88AXN7_FICCA|nr:hypothetical protein TIFTF001_020183 [Ficus carica]